MIARKESGHTFAAKLAHFSIVEIAGLRHGKLLKLVMCGQTTEYFLRFETCERWTRQPSTAEKSAGLKVSAQLATYWHMGMQERALDAHPTTMN
jgi:hypothetical protein